jgi:hypothetical protein
MIVHQSENDRLDPLAFGSTRDPATATSLRLVRMVQQPSNGHTQPQRRPWVEPGLVRHASLAALTRTQYPYDPSMGPMSFEQAAAMGVPCSQGFCF